MNSIFRGKSVPKAFKSESDSSKGKKNIFLGENRENPKKSVTPRVSYKRKFGKGVLGIGRSYFTT